MESVYIMIEHTVDNFLWKIYFNFVLHNVLEERLSKQELKNIVGLVTASQHYIIIW